MRTTNELRAEANDLEKQVKGDKLSGKKLAKAKARILALRYHANRRDKAAAKPSAKAVVKSTAKKSKGDPRQMQLPGFVAQVNNPTVEEMTKELIRSTLQKSIEARVEQIVNNVLPFKKAE